MPNKHRDYIAIERDPGQQVQVTIGEARAGGGTGEGDSDAAYFGQPTSGGRDIDGGFSQLFNRVMSTGIYARLSLPARAVYAALAFLADNTRHFVVDGGYGKAGRGVNLDRVMNVSGCGETAAKRALKELADRQLVRVLRRGGSLKNGARVASIYQLLLPVSGLEHLHLAGAEDAPKPGHDAHPYRGASQRGTGARGDPVRDRDVTGFGSAGRGGTGARRDSPSKKQVDSSKKISKKAAIDEGEELESPEAIARRLASDDEVSPDAARAALERRGVAEPMRSRLLGVASPEDVLRHALDFDLRNRSGTGPAKTAGWLAKSLLVGYDLGPEAATIIERATAARAAEARRSLSVEAERAEEARQREIDARVEAEYAAADDEELAAWRRRVLHDYPGLTRGMADADPRQNKRLRNLIKGMLASLMLQDG